MLCKTIFWRLTVVALICLICTSLPTVEGELLASTINWWPTERPNEMAFIYRLAWPGQNFITCNKNNCADFIVRNKHNVSYEQRLIDFRWKCVTGCKGNLQTADSMTFTSIKNLLDDQWEMAEGSFTFNFAGTMDDPVTFQLNNSTFSTRLDTCLLYLAPRNDTNRTNISPSVNVFPIERVPFEHDTTIDIFTFDGDGDQVQCRWANNSRFPNPSNGFLLDEERCRMHISPKAANGFSVGDLYHLSLIAEDFANHRVKWSSRVNCGPFSSVPFIISVRIGPKPYISTSGPTFIERRETFPAGMVISSLQFSWNAKVEFSVYGTGHAIIATGPRNMIFEHLEINDTTREVSYFNRTVENIGINMICAASYTSDGIPGDRRCFVWMIGDEDECISHNPPCKKAYCRNLWKRYICLDPEKVHIHPDISTDDIGLKVGVPLGISIPLAILLAIGIYFRDRILKIIRKPLIEPELEPAHTLRIKEGQSNTQEQTKADDTTAESKLEPTVEREHQKTSNECIISDFQ